MAKVGPCVICLGFTHDGAAAMRSLHRLASLDAETVLPGHGEPWTGGLPSAARAAIEYGLH